MNQVWANSHLYPPPSFGKHRQWRQKTKYGCNIRRYGCVPSEECQTRLLTVAHSATAYSLSQPAPFRAHAAVDARRLQPGAVAIFRRELISVPPRRRG